MYQMRIAVILLLALFAPLPFMGLVQSEYSYGLYIEGDPSPPQTMVVSSSKIEIIRDDIILKLDPIYPVDDPTTQSSDYGYRLVSNCNRCSRYHKGIDYPESDLNQEVYAIMDGRVIQVERSGEYGVHVILEHVIYPDELVYSTTYAHLKQSSVTNLLSIGDRVVKGDVLGYIGSTGLATGPHLHFEVHKNDKVMDPAVFFRRHADPVPN